MLRMSGECSLKFDERCCKTFNLNVEFCIDFLFKLRGNVTYVWQLAMSRGNGEFRVQIYLITFTANQVSLI